MSYKQSSYTSKPVNAEGIATYTPEENAVWHTLYKRQSEFVKGRACEAYMEGLRLLNMSPDRIPQCPEISKVLLETTGWRLEPVSALISFEKFFNLLAHQRFPAATFIRRPEELDYLQEPDIFHEIFGHCALLTNPAYAKFTHTYGQLGLNADAKDRAMLARLYWFTIEFGLIQEREGIRAYGGGILSSIGETKYSLESDIPKRLPFDPLTVLRTPYRIDVMQPVYFVLDHFDTLYSLTEMDLFGLIREARRLGEFPPLFQPD